MYVLVQEVHGKSSALGSLTLYGPFVSQAEAWKAWRSIGKKGFVYTVREVYAPFEEN